MPAPPPDQNLWYAEHLQPLATSLRAWLRGRFPALVDPDNLAQEALTRVWRAHVSGELRSAKAFLYATARNLAVDELRRRQTIAFDAVAEISELPVIDYAPNAAEAAARSQELDILTHAIQALPERCRQVLTLRKIYGLSQKAIASELGIAEHTVEAHIASGMRRCAEFLHRHGLP